MSSDYNLPLSSTEVLIGLLSKQIKNIFRFGYINPETLDNAKNSYSPNKGVFYNVKMSVCIELEDETLLCISSVEDVNSVSIDLVSKELLDEHDGKQDEAGAKFIQINHNNSDYGDDSYGRYIENHIEKIQVIRQLREDSKFLYWPNEVGVLIRLREQKEGIAIGLNLTKESSWGVIQVIHAGELSKEELVDYELIEISD